MIFTHADAGHASIFRPRGAADPEAATRGGSPGGSADWIVDRVGSGREVLLVGPASAGLANRLSGRDCRIEVVGCEPSRVDWLLLQGSGPSDRDQADLGSFAGGRRFDVIVVAEWLDCADEPAGLLVTIRELLNPGGYVVASQTSEPWRESCASASTDPPSGLGTSALDQHPGLRGRGSILAAFENSGFVVGEYRPLTLPGRFPDVEEIGPPSSPRRTIEGQARVERSLIVAHPIRSPRQGPVDPRLRALGDQRDEACRKAAGLARELGDASARVAALERLLAASVGREERLKRQVLRAQEQVARGDDEVASMALRLLEAQRRILEREAAEERLQAILRDVAAHRDELEARLLGFRQSLPGKLYRLARTLTSMGRR